jgi:hypothetical protein
MPAISSGTPSRLAIADERSEEGRIGRAGAYGIDGDAASREFPRNRLPECDQRGLASCVDGLPAGADAAGIRSDIDDAAGAALCHAG